MKEDIHKINNNYLNVKKDKLKFYHKHHLDNLSNLKMIQYNNKIYKNKI